MLAMPAALDPVMLPAEPLPLPTEPLPLVLASRSPRRRELLHTASIPHQVDQPAFDDAALAPGPVTPRGWVMALAFLKAWACAQRPGPPRLVVGADTTCVLAGRMIGTPAGAEDARRVLRGFSGVEHEVITGVAIVESHTRRRVMFAESARVTFGPVSDAAIDEYVASGLWSGKAGAYNLSERQRAGWPITFSGEPDTIMGLPVGALTRALRDFSPTRQ
jgi:septum formation protein